MTSPRAPFTPDRAVFPCPALLALAGRSGLGGARETLLGAVMAVRLVAGRLGAAALDAAVREARAEAARQWLAALTLPARTRTALLRAFATSASGDLGGAADAMDGVTDVTAPYLDKHARLELVRLASDLRTAAASLPPVPNGR